MGWEWFSVAVSQQSEHFDTEESFMKMNPSLLHLANVVWPQALTLICLGVLFCATSVWMQIKCSHQSVVIVRYFSGLTTAPAYPEKKGVIVKNGANLSQRDESRRQGERERVRERERERKRSHFCLWHEWHTVPHGPSDPYPEKQSPCANSNTLIRWDSSPDVDQCPTQPSEAQHNIAFQTLLVGVLPSLKQ